MTQPGVICTVQMRWKHYIEQNKKWKSQPQKTCLLWTYFKARCGWLTPQLVKLKGVVVVATADKYPTNASLNRGVPQG